MNRSPIFVCVMVAAALLSSCGGQSSAQKKAEQERLAQARTRLEQWETKLTGMEAGTAPALEALRAIIAIQVMELDAPKAAIDRFEANRAFLDRDLMSRVYLAVAQAKMAGAAKKTEQKLSWLRQGMSSFETLRADYPDEETVYLYQASTYASFPAEVGAKAEVLDILAEMLDRYRGGQWQLSEGAAGQLEWVFSTLGKTYPDKDSAAEIGELEAAFSADLPAFQVAYGRSVAEAERE
jgi:hypothetical protein